MVLTLPLVHSQPTFQVDTYYAINPGNRLEYGVGGTITSYKPSIINTVQVVINRP
ncbi:MAG: hypothetical protein QXS98_04170 [Candidatus Nitrosocaldus sp.]